MNRQALIRPEWTPATIGMMVVGFALYWPLGLAMLAYIIYGDRLRGFKTSANSAFDGLFGSFKRRGFSARATDTGNVAFDDWREAELARLDEERQKLNSMRDEFETYVRELRRAKDQEEFERFMRDRRAGNADLSV